MWRLRISFKKLIFLLLLQLKVISYIFAQIPGHFHIDTFKIPDWPHIHSFAFASLGEKVLMIGGRTDGIHPKESGFEYDQANTFIYVWNTATMHIASQSFNFPNKEINGFLSAANSTFTQDKDYLYMIGGYGQDASGTYQTYPYLAKINIADCIHLVESSSDPASAFEFIKDSFFAVAGGQMRIQDSLYYLVGGNYFEGKYSSNSSNVKQFYTDALSIFELFKDKDSLKYKIVFKKTDDYNFHRRDFNLSPFIDADGKEKLMVYSGVFQYNVNRPFLNTSIIDKTDVEEVFDFDQKFCAYNCAKLSFFDQTNNRSHQVFFGGMAEFYRDSVGQLTHDSYVPFVKSVSCITRNENRKFSEWMLPEEMPGFLGSNSEVYLIPGLPLVSNEIIDLNALSDDTTNLAYIFGGIYNLGPDRNPWQNDSAHLTIANPYLIKIRYIKNKPSSNIALQNKKEKIQLETYPNPAKYTTTVFLNTNQSIKQAYIWVQNSNGKILHTKQIFPIENNKFELDLSNLPAGAYFVYVLANQFTLLQTSLQVLDH
ncbi:MAG: T9SS type A sorting domain-containing protein [Saprospiraceae bacterium]|nr:T9SS type A sorting domain-containing protein [Saprospiraceae bacterium]